MSARNPSDSVLLTDLYQLTMLQGYFDRGMEEEAVFEFYVRKLSPNRGFLVAAGLEQALHFLETLQFNGEELEWLASLGRFTPAFLNYLANLRFTGDVHAPPEGTVLFPEEPLIRITAPLPQAQLVESRIINLLHFQTMIASKAARVVLASQGKPLIDFGMRRAHGAEAALFAARACYLAGYAGTATVLAGKEFGIPVSGTMAHAFVLSHDSEAEAFDHFARSQPNDVVLLIDTYDTEAAARKLIRLAPRLKDDGIAIRAVRIDSGDFDAMTRSVRRILDEGGLSDVKILVSGDMDEFSVRDLVSGGAPIDGFGVGTRVDTSVDAPYLNSAYKLQEYAGKGRRKRSTGKSTWPGRKQAFRTYNADGRMAGDVLTLDGVPEEGEALIRPVMWGGRRLHDPEPLEASRERTKAELSRLPEPLQRLETEPAYPVTLSPALHRLAQDVDRRMERDDPL